MEPQEILRIAIQKSGRLSEDSKKLIRECGISLNRYDQRLKSRAFNFPLEIFFLRDDDIPEYVSNGVADIGIVGENLLVEKQRPVEIMERLGFSKCRLSLAVPENSRIKTVKDLEGLTIATSYPRSLNQYLESQSISASIREIRGSTEIAPSIGLADAICDLVSSGSTLFSNRLCEIETVLQSEAVLISSSSLGEGKRKLLDKFVFRVRSVLTARRSKYILLNAPNEAVEGICQALPGLRSPTVLPLAEPGWSSVHSVIDEDRFWDVIEELEQAGAQGILVCPIEKMIQSPLE